MDFEEIDRATKLAVTHFVPFTVMLAVMDKSKPSSIIVKNGTGTLIDTGVSRFLVTNHHVYDFFRSLRADSPEIVLKMSGVDGADFLDISESRVAGLDKDHDLAVLCVPEERVLFQGKRFAVCESWPPQRPEEGIAAYIVGYPGQGRRQVADKVELRPAFALTTVQSVGKYRFILVDPNGAVEGRSPAGVNPLTSYGGMSGSAVYISADERTFRLVGFMFEAAPSMVVILATFADYINADGTIREGNF
jgi:hypothetical protein